MVLNAQEIEFGLVESFSSRLRAQRKFLVRPDAPHNAYYSGVGVGTPQFAVGVVKGNLPVYILPHVLANIPSCTFLASTSIFLFSPSIEVTFNKLLAQDFRKKSCL